MISVIVPIYNAERYLLDCINSILNQSYTDIELILVNDGSSDNSLSLCNQYEDRRIVIINKPNGGVSSARNAGLNVAKGKYICFVDSDDTLPVDAIQTLHDVIEQNDVDTVVGAFQFQYGDVFLPHALRLQEGKYEFANIMNTFIDDGTLSGFLLGSVCGGIYKKSIIHDNNLRFVEGLKNNEDGLFNFEYALVSKFLYMIDMPVYNYRQDNVPSKPNRNNENFGEKVFDILNMKIWPKYEYDYEIQKLRRNVTLAWWDILHFANNYPLIKSIAFIHNKLSQKNVLLGMRYMCPQKMNRYKKIIFFMMKHRLCIMFSITLRYFIPIMQKRFAR